MTTPTVTTSNTTLDRAYTVTTVIQPSIYNNHAAAGIIPTATLINLEDESPVPTSTVVTTVVSLPTNSNSSSSSNSDDSSDRDFDDTNDLSMESSLPQQQELRPIHHTTIEKQLQQIPKHPTPINSRELQELASRQQPSFEVAPQPSYNDMKQIRKSRQAVSAIAGGTVGLVTLGPLGIYIGALGGAAITKGVSKSRERHILKGYEQRTNHLNMVPARLGELV